MSIFDLKNLLKNACQLVLKNKFKMLLFIWVKMWYDVIIFILYLYTQYGDNLFNFQVYFCFCRSRVCGLSRTLEAPSTHVRSSMKYIGIR